MSFVPAWQTCRGKGVSFHLVLDSMLPERVACSPDSHAVGQKRDSVFRTSHDGARGSPGFNPRH
jgi:hypothetical protein